MNHEIRISLHQLQKEQEAFVEDLICELERRAVTSPTSDEIDAWHTRCADATRDGSAGHYWAFEVQSDYLREIVAAALEQWGAPAEPVGDVPTDEDLDELFTEIDQGGEALSWRAYARAVLSRYGYHPAPVAEGEAGELVDKLRVYSSECSPLWAGLVRRAADILTRLALQPVPVAEKPWEREGWCDGDDQCWMGDPGGGGFIPSWRLCRPEDAPRMSVALPAHAIPLPQAGEGRP